MASGSPPPLHTPEPSSSFHTIKAQWNMLHHYLQSLIFSETRATSPQWLSTLDRKVLLTALVKKRTEAELLKLEAEHAESTSNAGVDLKFPDYNAGFVSPRIQAAPTRPGARLRMEPSPAGSRVPAPINTNSHYHRRISGFVQPSPLPDGISGTSQLSPLSPLSPSFGPRRFDVFSGTVSRRRSIQTNSPLSPHRMTARPADESIKGEGDLVGVWERRILWEAAWVEIERKLDEYVERFGKEGWRSNAGSEEGNRDGKEGIWEELVRLRVEGQRLEQRIRSAREDVRG